MIRILGTRLILPKGDTGFFSLPNKGIFSDGDIAVFSVKSLMTQQTVIEKIIDASSCALLIEFEKEDTMNLDAGKYFWDIKIYRRPIYDEDNLLVDALEVDSYYSAYKQPLLIIKEVSKSYV